MSEAEYEQWAAKRDERRRAEGRGAVGIGVYLGGGLLIWALLSGLGSLTEVLLIGWSIGGIFAANALAERWVGN